MSIFTDFDLNLQIHPLTKDVVKIEDEAFLIQLIKNVMFSEEFLTFPYSSEGGELLSLLLSPNVGIIVPRVKSRTMYLLTKHIKIINVISVDVTQDIETISIFIEFSANNDIELLSTTIIFERVR